MPDRIPPVNGRAFTIEAAKRPDGVRVLARAPALNRDAELIDENRSILAVADDQPWEHFYYFEGEFFENCVFRMTAAAAELDRLKAGNAAMLMHHDRRMHMGRLSEAWITNGQLQLAADFSMRDEPQKVKGDVDEGILRGISIGAEPIEARVVRMPTPEDPGGLLEFTKWRLLEASLTPVPENNRARVISADTAAAIQADVDPDRWQVIEARLTPDEEGGYAVESGVQREIIAEIRAAIGASRQPKPNPAPVEETDKVTPEELQAEVDRLSAEIEANKADAAKSAELQASIDKVKAENSVAAIEAERREEIRDLALRHGVGHEVADQAIEASVKSIDFAKQLAQARSDGDGGNKPIPAVAKPTPDMGALNLDAITAELWGEKNDPENVQLREAAGESHRIIEVVRAQQPHRYGGSLRGGRGGYMIPDTLLLAEANERLDLHQRSARHEGMVAATQRRLIEAAVTTTTTAAGIIDPMVLQGDLVDTLIGINGLISYCSIYPNLSSPISIPKVTAAPRAAGVLEGAAASAAATLTIDDIDFVPKQLRVFWSITPESYVTSQGRSPSIAVSEAGRLMMDEAEEEIWQGNDAGGRVQGIENKIATTRSADYANAITDTNLKIAVRGLQTGMSQEKIPTMGRMWVASPLMCAWADLQFRVQGVDPLVMMGAGGRMMFGYPFIESTYPTESGQKGRMYHLSPMQIGVAFFGGDTELILDRENATGNYLGTLIKLWDVQYKRNEFVQRSKET